MSTRQPKPTFTDARSNYLESTQRKNRAVPVRRLFVQQGTQRRAEPGVLAEMVRRHDATALDLVLLLWPRPSRRSIRGRTVRPCTPSTLHNAVWGRLLGDVAGATAARAWARLEDDYQLVRRKRSGRMVDVLQLREDGTGSDYTRPSGGSADRYFQVAFDYWLAGPANDARAWIDVLSLPAKAMLLVALSLEPGFVLPVDKAPRWYGVSSDSAQRGLDELREHGLLASEYRTKAAPLSKEGFTREYHHRLLTPFDRRDRLATRNRLHVVA
jgi:hypothetical protein